MKKISVGFLVFNENESLKQTILKAHSSLKRFSNDFEICVFDNNSSDGTSKTVEDLCKEINELVLFKQSKNIGYAQNLHSAISNMNANFIFVIDGDGQYDVDDVKDSIRLLEKNDVIFGVRKPRQDPILRILMSYFLKNPRQRALKYSAFGVPLLVTGMMVAASALRFVSNNEIRVVA